MKKKRLLPLGILAVLVLAVLIYTRPMTLQEIGKVDIAQCESVSGYHRRAPDSEFTSFELSAEDERCSQLIDLFAQQKYRRSLINLLSPDGGSTHQPKDGDFIWDLSFNFGPTDFPDGSTGKGSCRSRESAGQGRESRKGCKTQESPRKGQGGSGSSCGEAQAHPQTQSRGGSGGGSCTGKACTQAPRQEGCGAQGVRKISRTHHAHR